MYRFSCQLITSGREERIVEIISFIQKNYVDVTLDMLVDTFHLSKPYLSKYIKEKAGMTFQEVVREERMKKARMLLKETNQTVETIAANVGYENVEHFNRLFEQAGKIISIFNAYFIAYLIYLHIGGIQQQAGLLYL